MTPDPLYYLSNFKDAVAWVIERNLDLLTPGELAFADEFAALPVPSQALLVRLIMRRGDLFRHSKIDYPEIDDLDYALGPLLRLRWIDPEPGISLDELFRLSTRKELAQHFPILRICSLFGLLCWEAIFEPVRGAFFHRFHSAPADLMSPDFEARRHLILERCLARLDDGTYQGHVAETFAAKFGTQSPFVHWRALSDQLLDLALKCIQPRDIKQQLRNTPAMTKTAATWTQSRLSACAGNDRQSGGTMRRFRVSSPPECSRLNRY